MFMCYFCDEGINFKNNDTVLEILLE